MAKELRPGTPLIYSAKAGGLVKMGVGCTNDQLMGAGKELQGIGFTIRENRAFLPLDMNAHSAPTAGGQHYAWDGYGAFDINFWLGGSNNTWREACAIDVFAMPVLDKHGVRGIIWRPIGREDHYTWAHADRGVYRNRTIRRWSSSQIEVVRKLLLTPTTRTVAPTGKLAVDGLLGPSTIRRWQQVMGTPIDGVISRPSSLIRAVQKVLGVTVDGLLGPATIRALQKRFGTTADGTISQPSQMVRALQTRLNEGRF